MKENIFVRLGLFRSTLLFTLISVTSSVLIAMCFYIILGRPILTKNIFIPIIIPLIVAPLITFHHARLIIKISMMEKQSRSLAITDQLTNLLNRHGLYEAANIIQELSKRNKKPFSLLYCDLDYFKKINDNYGHKVGDLVLQKISKIIQKHKRKSDLAARLGGDEFLLVLAETDKRKAMILAKRIRNEIAQLKIKYKTEEINISASFGISDNADNLVIDFDHLIAMADKALYTSKKDGRNCISIYGTENASLFK